MVSSSLCTSPHTMPVISFWPAAEELSSLFEKKNFRVKSPCSGKQSILSVRLEQCPLQLNNPFNEYSKFDGKVSDGSLGSAPCAGSRHTPQCPPGAGTGYLETSKCGASRPRRTISPVSITKSWTDNEAVPFSSRLVGCTFNVTESWDISLGLMVTPFVLNDRLFGI